MSCGEPMVGSKGTLLLWLLSYSIMFRLFCWFDSFLNKLADEFLFEIYERSAGNKQMKIMRNDSILYSLWQQENLC